VACHYSTSPFAIVLIPRIFPVNSLAYLDGIN
jgi:hypothetical protein